MQKEETIGNKLKNLIRWFDFSGESFTFKYRDKNKLSTLSAGIIYIIFFVLALSYFISTIIPFLNHQIFKLQYYETNSDKNEKIVLDGKTTTFAFGLTNENTNNEYNINDLFKLSVEYIEKVGKLKATQKRNIEPIKCMKSDFIYINDDSILWEDLKKMYCLNKIDLKKSPEGIYTDSYFSYFTITVKSKYENNETHYNIIEDYLAKYGCKLQLYYTDIRFDLDSFYEPLTYIVNSMFLQLNPTLIQKKNIYYMNYHLENDTRLFKLSKNNVEPRKETGISRVEDYSVYRGLNRSFKDSSDYGKIYIRADNKKIIIKRNYQDLFEFYAEKTSLWLSLYLFLGFLFSLYDRENANHSISKKLFYFEGIKKNKFNKLKELKELINKIQENERNEQNNIVQISPFTTRNISTIRALNNNNFIRRNTNSRLNNDLKTTEKLINYENYNLFEMILSQKLFFCKSKSFESKINLFSQAKNIIDDKLDIIYYIRKMILFEIINEIQLENKNIINFLSRPIIYLKDIKDRKKKSKNDLNNIGTNFSIDTEDIEEQSKIEEKMNIDPIEILKEYTEDEAYKTAYKLNPYILTKKIEQLLKKQDKTNTEIKLLSYLKKQLKGIH